jgi:hypothetical protein
LARRAPGVAQRPPGVGELGPVAPGLVGQLAIGRRVRELHRGGDADLGEAGDIGRIEQLGVLDARAQAEREPDVAGTGEGVERVAVGSIADGVDSHREARAGPAPDDGRRGASLDVISTPVPSSIRAVPEPRVPSMNTFR